MEFRLIYRGQLPAQSSGGGGGRLQEKHAIRKAIHKQLANQWKESTVLSLWMAKNSRVEEGGTVKIFTAAEHMASRYAKFGYNWLPLITEQLGIACSLDILFLRRDAPGKIIQSGGGDIDNRVKVLFDGLRVPKYSDEIKNCTPELDEDPFFCLLEDDSLINEVKITTDRLLTPLESGEAINDVILVIHVRTIVVNSLTAPIEFYT